MNEPGKFGFSGLVILEMANNHQGSVEHGKRIIRELAPVVNRAGVRAAIKFQLRDVDTFIHQDHRQGSDNIHIPRFISTRLSEEELQELVNYARVFNFTTMATPFDEASVDQIERLGIDVIKVASASASDWPLLKRISRSGKPVVCSTGGIGIEKVDNVVSFLTHRGVHFALMHCVAIYPTPDHKLKLIRIRHFCERYPNITIGFSTHEDPDNVDAVKVAYAMGARIFEKHVGVETDQIKLNKYSLSPDQLARWLDAYNRVISMTGTDYDSTRRSDPDEQQSLTMQKRGVFFREPVMKGHMIPESSVFFAIPMLPEQLESGAWRDGIVADRDYRAGEPLPERLLPATVSTREVVYKAIHDARAMLNIARVPINYDSNVTLQHHEGIHAFNRIGAIVIDCIQRSYSKKIYLILSGQSYPKHYNKKREKTYQVLWGVLTVAIEDRKRDLHPGETVLIPNGIWHSFSSQTGAIFEEISLSADDSNDKVFSNKVYQDMSVSGSETKLIGWGRHQFDELEENDESRSRVPWITRSEGSNTH